jgi:ketosteroid isomerase-like protein
VPGANAEFVRELLGRFNESGEIDWSRMHPEFELTAPEYIPDARTYKGRQGVRDFVEQITSTFESPRWEIHELVEVSGDVIVTSGAVRGRGRSSGIPVEAPESQVWEFRDGRLWRLRAFGTMQEAMAVAAEAAGGP